MNRRELFTLGAKAMLLAGGTTYANTTPFVQQNKEAKKREGEPLHIVVVGGGWAGLSFAKQMKQEEPNAKVTLIERRDHFVSCPASNAWLFDLVDLAFLTHSYLDAANSHGYDYLHAEATGLQADKNILETTKGEIAYDYLVFATGIEYDYEAWTKGDKVLEEKLRRHYPAAFIPGSEHLTLKRKLKAYKGGNFIVTVPSGNYRCLPAPYERACLLADYIKQNKIDGQVIIVDENNTVTIKEEGFLSTFRELYKKELVYLSGSRIETIDLEKKIVETEFDEIHFEDASFYPNVRAPKLLEKLGLTTQTPYNRVEANLDIHTNQFKGYSNIFGCGDLRPMGFSKSGNTAYTEGANVAKIVSNAIKKKKLVWKTPITFCVSLVSMKPQREISLVSEYKYGAQGQTQFKSTQTDEAWKSNTLGENRAQFMWASSMFDSMFYC